MKTVISLHNNERALYFQEAAAQSNKIKSPAIIEKDFWLCFALKQLFSINEINKHITFKGGTSLSKCYQIIDRFSEDCDLTIDKSFLGIDEGIETFASKGRSQRDKSLNILAKAAKDRMFRHYYDMVMLHKQGVTGAALKDLALLETVLMNKKNYFASPVASYETAKIGTLKLMPNNLFIDLLRKDYKNMADMFFGDTPDFDEILSEIKAIETIIND